MNVHSSERDPYYRNYRRDSYYRIQSLTATCSSGLRYQGNPLTLSVVRGARHSLSSILTIRNAIDPFLRGRNGGKSRQRQLPGIEAHLRQSINLRQSLRQNSIYNFTYCLIWTTF